jgi:PAS domain S-box-containing protein
MESQSDLTRPTGGDILIVDDEVANLQLLRDLLSRAGYRVRPALGPQLALESARAHPPELILLDVRMPEMDGFEVCRQLKADERTRDVPVLFVSAMQETIERVRAFEAGGVDFVSKPFQAEEVLARVRAHLALRQMTLHLESLVDERTAELQARHEALRAEMAERIRIEDELRQSHDYLQQLTDSMADIVFSVKVPERIVAWVNHAVEQLGYRPDECIGRTTEFLYADQADFAAMAEDLRRAEKDGTEVLHKEVLLRRKEGGVFPADVTISLFRVGGKLVSVTGIARDIAERLEKEQRIQEYQNRLKALAADLTLSEERERRRIAEQLHDGPGQALAYARMRLASLSKHLGDGGQARALDEVSSYVREAAQETGRVVSGLSPKSLLDQGLVSALRDWATEQSPGGSGIEIEIVSRLEEGEDRGLSDLTRTFLFRNTRELLTNVVKHAGASRVQIVVQRSGEQLELLVRDDGQGCDPTQALAKNGGEGGFGLFSIRERMADLGGVLEIDSQPGRGFTATLLVPSAFGGGPGKT